jgi:hypothetical protein
MTNEDLNRILAYAHHEPAAADNHDLRDRRAKVSVRGVDPRWNRDPELPVNCASPRRHRRRSTPALQSSCLQAPATDRWDFLRYSGPG